MTSDQARRAKINATYLESVKAGLEHVGWRAEEFANLEEKDRPDVMIEEGRGSRDGCVRSLRRVHLARAIVAWFRDRDLLKFKRESYITSKLEFILLKDANEIGWLLEQEWFSPLMSDHKHLIDYWASFKPASDHSIKQTSNPKEHAFRHYQMTLALRGDWKELARRAQEQLDSDPPKMKKFMVDQSFYLALARGDKAGMEDALAELTSPPMAKARNDQLEFGYTHFFIGTHATMYAKIAWRAGYEIAVDTPYIPKEWLPVCPLEKHEDPYPFMRAYDLDSLSVNQQASSPSGSLSQ